MVQKLSISSSSLIGKIKPVRSGFFTLNPSNTEAREALLNAENDLLLRAKLKLVTSWILIIILIVLK